MGALPQRGAPAGIDRKYAGSEGKTALSSGDEGLQSSLVQQIIQT